MTIIYVELQEIITINDGVIQKSGGCSGAKCD